MDLGIRGRRAAVAAASQGLGYAIAAALAAEGVHVAVCSRRREAIDAAAERIGGGAIPLVADLSVPGGGASFVRDAREALGGLDILVLNTGGPRPGGVGEVAIDDYSSAFDQVCRSVIEMCDEALPSMREQGWGRVVAVTSVAVKQPLSTLVLSNVARSGLTAYLKTLSLAVAAEGVTVNSLLPGFHETERLTDLYDAEQLAGLAGAVPVRTIGRPDDFGACAAYLCSEQARYVTGTAIQVDGGICAGLL